MTSAVFLTKILGERFLDGANRSVAEVKHPILQRWTTNGAGAFLELNALAADLAAVSSVAGFETVVHDLRNPNTCLATWHTIHTAALLGRAPECRVIQFFPQTDELTPDFVIEHDHQQVMCEAKLLSKSGPEEIFEAYAVKLSTGIMQDVLVGITRNPSVVVVLKDVHSLPPKEDVLARAVEGVARVTHCEIAYRSELFNLFVSPYHRGVVAETGLRSCYILCPKSEKEDLRVQRPGAKASKQLSSKVASGEAGLLLLGVTRLQDPGYVAKLFRRKFAGGTYPGIAGVLLIAAGTHMVEPTRAPLDLVAAIRNEHHPKPLPSFPLSPVGLLGQLPAHSAEEIPAYRYFVAEARVSEGFEGLFVPDVRVLTEEMLSV